MPDNELPYTNSQRAQLALSYIKVQRQLYDAVDAAVVAAIKANSPGALSVAMLGTERPAMVCVVFGEDDIRDFRATLLGHFSTANPESIQPTPVIQPTGVTFNRKAKPKDQTNG